MDWHLIFTFACLILAFIFAFVQPIRRYEEWRARRLIRFAQRNRKQTERLMRDRW